MGFQDVVDLGALCLSPDVECRPLSWFRSLEAVDKPGKENFVGVERPILLLLFRIVLCILVGHPALDLLRGIIYE